MRSAGCLLSLLVVAAIGLFIYRGALTDGSQVVSPEERIDTVRYKTDLISIAQAERVYVITHSRYGTLEDLVEARAIHFQGSNRHGYQYDIQVDGDRHFLVTARPVEAKKAGWPTFQIDETMQVTESE